MPIRILPPSVVARIAAGEVIDRPASVVRELIENAVDAGATRIEVVAREELTSTIIVSDDGVGIPPDELSLALARHATSKLPNDDLFAIRTLGFRGEALPSIAAVADIKLASRRTNEDVGWEVEAIAGQVSPLRPSPLRSGTRVEVRNLFGRVPARLKFLKSRRTELALVRDVFDSAALACPDIEFVLTTSRTARYQRQGERRDPGAVHARAMDILGKVYRDDSVPIRRQDDAIEILGSACVPTSAGKGDIIVIVNGRRVNNRDIVSAVKAAYKDLVVPGSTPYATVSIIVPPDAIDLNIHPRKAEVRFRDTEFVRASVTEAVRSALTKAGLRTSSRFVSLARTLAKTETTEVEDRRRLPLGRFVGQVDDSWIVTETADGIAIIDQHAAHERIILERLKAHVQTVAIDSVPLRTPTAVAMTEAELAAVEPLIPRLSSLGLEIQVTGDFAMVSTIPAFFGPTDAVALIKEIAASAIRDPLIDPVGDRLLEILSTAACRAAIKAGDPLSPERADHLLREIEATPNTSQCNHGRPCVVFWSRRDLERLFARR